MGTKYSAHTLRKYIEEKKEELLYCLSEIGNEDLTENDKKQADYYYRVQLNLILEIDSLCKNRGRY